VVEAVESELKQYRGKMSPEQLAVLESSQLHRAVLQTAGLPRLSMFYTERA
jgi:hypothetical protein